MATRICNANQLVQRVSVFVSEFIRKTYGFLTPDHVTERRNFRNEVEDNYPGCTLTTPHEKDNKKRSASDVGDFSDAESEVVTPPAQKQTKSFVFHLLLIRMSLLQREHLFGDYRACC